MKKVALFSILLIAGLVGSQFLPSIFEGEAATAQRAINLLAMVALAFLMIHVGYEFEIDQSNLRPFAWDYVVAMTTAALPWVFATLYFVWVLLPPGSAESWEAWKEALLTGRFAAPTSAGVLFSMLAAAGLSATWVFRKARVLAIFDDLDTVLLMIPLKMMHRRLDGHSGHAESGFESRLDRSVYRRSQTVVSIRSQHSHQSAVGNG